MTRRAEITLPFGDGEYLFRLPIKQLIELQEKADAGPAHIHARLQSGTWRIEDVRETVRLALIGGGITPTEAFKLTSRYVDERPKGECVFLAEAILGAAIVGVEDEPPPKPEAGEEIESPTSSAAKSDGAHISEPA